MSKFPLKNIGRQHNSKFPVKQVLLLLGLTALRWLQAFPVVCARGIYRAGCVGPRGGVVMRRPIHRYHGCYWRAGVRVCR